MEANVWVKKYFKAASLVCWSFLCKIKGMNDSKFNSSPTQAEIQFVDERVIIVPVKSAKENKVLIKIVRRIAYQWGMNPMAWLILAYLTLDVQA